MPRPPRFQHAETSLPPLNVAIDAPDNPTIGPATRKDYAAERVLRLWKHHAERGVIPELGTTTKAKAVARVNAGRWLVDCPFEPCHSAQLAAFTDRRFFCIECENRQVGGLWVPVVWPGPAALAKIEAALEVRPAEHQHWRPGEKLADLLRENDEHGLSPATLAARRAAEQAARIVLPWEA